MTEDTFDGMLEAARTWCGGRDARRGAGPPTLVLATPDLPVDAGALTGAGAASLYALTSPGALAPPSAETDPDFADAAFAAGLEFGLRLFAARHVLVLSHAGCALVEALTAEADGRAMAFTRAPALARFAAMAGPAIARTMRPGLPDADRRRFAAMELVRASVENLMSYPVLLDAVMSGRAALHGWVLEPAEGRLWALDPEEDAFRPT